MLEKLYPKVLEHYALKYRVLEYTAAKPLEVASSKELLQAISDHATAYAGGDKTITTDLTHKQLLNSILNRLGDKTIDPQLKASLFLAEKFNANLINNYQLSRPIKQIYYIFTLAWFRYTVEEPQKAYLNDSPIHYVVKLLMKLSRRVDQYSGSLVRNYCHSLFRMLLAYANSSRHFPAIDKLINKIRKVEGDLEKQRKINLMTTIKNFRYEQKIRASREVTSEKVRETIGDGIYPVIFLDFVESYINLFLEDYYVKNGPKGNEWRQTMKDLSYIIWAFRAEVDKNYREYYPTKIPPAMYRLLLKVEPFVEDTKILYEEFIGLEDILHARYLGEFIKLESVFNAPYFSGEALYGNQARIWHQSNQNETDWYHILYHHKEISGQLLSKDILQQQIAFINYSGKPIVVHDTNAPDFSAQDIQVIPMREIDDWDYLNTALEYEISNMQTNFYDAYDEVIKKIEIDNVAQAKERQALKAELEKRNMEMRMEIERRKQQKLDKKRKAEAREYERRALEEQKRIENKEKIKKIKIGASVYAEYKNSHKIKMQLNIITSTTNRYIFTDKTCQHKLALNNDELLDMLVAGKITIESFGRGEQYHQTLANVIAARRNIL